LKRASTRFSRGVSPRAVKFLITIAAGFALAAFLISSAHAANSQSPQSPSQPQPAPRKTNVSVTSLDKSAPVSARRNDELTLAGLRPGQDDLAKAQKFFRKPSLTKFDGTNHIWQDPCLHQSLSIIADSDTGTIQEVRISENNSRFESATPSSTPSERGCTSAAAVAEAKSRWTTGHGLVIGAPCPRVIELYGQPGSRGPSTKDGQQLELFYYAFDWAGPDVPQVMAILCTPEKSANPGRVVEITLMAPSL
jgi:hypothetical protein